MDEKFFLAISFFIFLLLTYRPIKGFIFSLVDDKIRSIRDRFEEAYAIEEGSSQKLKYAESRANEAIKYSNNSPSLVKQDTEFEIMKMSLEFDQKVQAIRRQSSLLMENIKSKKIAEIKKEIVDSAYQRALANLKNNT